MITRALPEADSILVAHPVAVKVREGTGGGRNGLCRILEKGAPLPADAMRRFKAVRGLTSDGKDNHLGLEFYQGQDGRLSATDSLFIGSVEVTGKHLTDRTKIRGGDEITLRWEMSAAGILTATVEFPRFGRKSGNFYVPQPGCRRLDFDREAKIARSLLEDARRDADILRNAVAAGARAECEGLSREIESQSEFLDNAGEIGTAHGVVTEMRRIAGRIAEMKFSPENRGEVLRQKILAEDSDWFSRYIRARADAEKVRLFDRHRDDCLASIDEGDLRAAEFHLGEAAAICGVALWSDPAFLRDQFNFDRGREHLAADREEYRRLLQRGLGVMSGSRFMALRGVIGGLRDLQIDVSVPRRSASDLASIVEA